MSSTESARPELRPRYHHPDLPRFELEQGEFKDKVFVITGGTSGLGFAMAHRAVQLGASVLISSRGNNPESEARVYAALDQLNQVRTDSAVWIPSHATDPKMGDELVAKAVERFGRLDIVMGNAGVRVDGLLIRMTDEQMTGVMEANFMANFRLVRAAINQFRAQRPRGGVILLTSSVAREGNPGQANYAASKAATASLIGTVAREYGSSAIRAYATAPGLADTPFIGDLSERQTRTILEMTLSTRKLTPGEVAEVSLRLVSDRAPDNGVVNGETYTILPHYLCEHSSLIDLQMA